MSSSPDHSPSSAGPRSEETEGTVPPPEGGTQLRAPPPKLIQANQPSDAASEPTSAFPFPAGTADFAAGSTLGPYELLEKIGQGGMGAVYKARHQHLDKLVAVKVLPQQVTQQPESISRFRREMKAVGKIEHPNIVRAMDAGEINGTHYLAMEYVEGTDLAQLVRQKGPFSVPNACKAVRQAALALSAAHQAGLVHRDIKPSNLLVAKTGQVKLLDLGLALLGDDVSVNTEVTAAGQAFGTPDYMAPEQWADAHTADARTDLYALGCTLFFVLTGHAPYGDDKHKHPLNKMTGHCTEPIPDLKAARDNVPDAVVAIYQKLLTKSPNDRYQTAAELIDALAPFASSKAVVTNPPTQSSSSVVPSEFDATVTHRPTPSATVVVPTTKKSASLRKLSTQFRAWGCSITVVMSLCLMAAFGFLLTATLPPPIEQQSSSGHFPPADVPLPAPIDSQSTGWHGWPADAPQPAIAPFDTAQAKKHQKEWAAYLKVPVEYTNTIGMKFRLIPPGEFLMGSTEEAVQVMLNDVHPNAGLLPEFIQSEAPQHKVILTRPLFLAMNEVTQGEYEKVMGTNPSHFASTGMGKETVDGMETSNHPVEMVRWNDAVEFCSKLSKQEEYKPFYLVAGKTITPLDGTGYRLPSEAEWEFACRAGTVTKYWIGDKDEDLVRAGWFRGNSLGRTHAVGELKANPFGLSDILGNVWEWVEDGWDESYYSQFQEKLAINPTSSFNSSNRRVSRGGHWLIDASVCRSSLRAWCELPSSYSFNGFRVALSIEAVRQALASRANTWHGWPADAPKPAIAPFDAAQAKQHQEEWAEYLKVPVEYENSIGMKFRLIPPGEFLMGSTMEEIETSVEFHEGNKYWQNVNRSEFPRHKVLLTNVIYLGIYEVTQKQYEAVCGANPSLFSTTGNNPRLVELIAGLDTRLHPVENVNWNDAAKFCAKMSELESLKPFYRWSADSVTSSDGTGYRLPTEAEWEFACRAGTTTKYATGDEGQDLADSGWIRINSNGRTHTVGGLGGNPFGMFDMHGNVWEWGHDYWDAMRYAKFATKPAVNPMGTGTERVLRGGGFANIASDCRSSGRGAEYPNRSNDAIGLRVALPVDIVKELLKRDMSK